MNNFVTTLVFCGVAGVLALIAVIAQPSRPGEDFDSDVGETFFPAFESPDQTYAIAVTGYNKNTLKVERFRIEFSDEGWIIPSHSNHPADKTHRVKTVATGFIGVEKVRLVTEAKGMHDDYGVMDPESEDASAMNSGRLVEFFDKSGGPLGRLIVGRSVEENPEYSYVRVPEESRVYEASVPSLIPTSFTDWVDEDILKIGRQEITGVKINNYRFTIRTNNIRYILNVLENKDLGELAEYTALQKQDKQWTVADPPGGNFGPNLQVFDDEVLFELDTQLNIVDVAPSSDALKNLIQTRYANAVATPPARQLKAQVDAINQRLNRLAPQQQASSNEVQVFSNSFAAVQSGNYIAGASGEVVLEQEKGRRYTIRFGRPESRQLQGQSESGEYYPVYVSVEFDPALVTLDRPEEPEEPELYFPADTRGDQALTDTQKQEMEKYDRQLKKFNTDMKNFNEKKIPNYREQVEKLKQRYLGWFYYVPKSVHDTVFKPQSELIEQAIYNPSDQSFTTTDSGLRFKDLAPGNGPLVTAENAVGVRYSGRLLYGGEQFDDNVEKNPQGGYTKMPFQVELDVEIAGDDFNNAVDGFEEGLIGMNGGGKRLLVIPPELGYKGQRKPNIPPWSPLVFEIEVVEIFDNTGVSLWKSLGAEYGTGSDGNTTDSTPGEDE